MDGNWACFDLSTARLASSHLRSRGQSGSWQSASTSVRPSCRQHEQFSLIIYYCDRCDWLIWAGLGVVASAIGPAVKPLDPLLPLAFPSALDGFQSSDGVDSCFCIMPTFNISILAAFAPTGPIIRDLAHHNASTPPTQLSTVAVHQVL